jgi:hypothetical protein
MATVTITWKAFGDRPERNRFVSSATVELNGIWNDVSNNLLLETIFKTTNLQSELADFGAYPQEIELWETIEKALPANRTHTSLSVGDEIQINRSYAAIENQDGPTYKVADIGFELVGA